jgi:hypothetical protein
MERGDRGIHKRREIIWLFSVLTRVFSVIL